MATFTPPTRMEHSDDFFFGRFGVPVGISVLWNGSTFVEHPYPWLGELTGLIEGQTWFQGGRTYTVSDTTGTLLTDAGFSLDA